ncbi:expressed protein [Echinococcus multilocularis]|uniref:Expressed protein n=1 Tax=Echinococcus multilocularis TaxID=6211 RepID=A0A068YHX2_ECHMU|nr:expressed protein [Echinococcus multilocularis]
MLKIYKDCTVRGAGVESCRGALRFKRLYGCWRLLCHIYQPETMCGIRKKWGMMLLKCKSELSKVHGKDFVFNALVHARRALNPRVWMAWKRRLECHKKKRANLCSGTKL